jgi:hypothetical protein
VSAAGAAFPVASLQPASVAAARPAAANATINGRAPFISAYEFFILIPLVLKTKR